jgi:uncharacterized membrane protein
MIPNSRPLIAAGTLMGIGLGGFFDGILFHQILELHNMLSNWVPRTTLVNAEINMFWDGLFHAFCYVGTLTALYMLWRWCNPSRCAAVRANLLRFSMDRLGHFQSRRRLD